MDTLSDLGVGLGLPALLAALAMGGALCLRRLAISPVPVFVVAGLTVSIVPSLIPKALVGLTPAWAAIVLFLPLVHSCGVFMARPLSPRLTAAC